MTHHDAFLADILARPDDDTPRLIYADWLEEHGDPARAEFIRAQCELGKEWEECHFAHMQEGKRCSETARPDAISCNVCRRRGEYERRERELLEAHKYGWADGLLGPGWKTCGEGWSIDPLDVSFTGGGQRVGPLRLSFRRGFVGEVTCSAAEFLRHRKALFAAAPVRRVRLTTPPDIRIVGRHFQRAEDRERRVVNLREFAEAHWGALRPLALVSTGGAPYGRPGDAGRLRLAREQVRREMDRLLEPAHLLGAEGGWFPGVTFEVPPGNVLHNEGFDTLRIDPVTFGEWGRSNSTPLGDLRALRERMEQEARFPVRPALPD